MNCPADQLLSYVEFVLREAHEDNGAHLDDLYDVALIHNDSRRSSIMEAMAAFGGD